MKKIVYIRNVPVGDGTVTIQSMTNTLTTDVNGTVKQILALRSAGADFVRVSIPDLESAKAVKHYMDLGIPIIGDIHFDAKPALLAMENGIDKIRINPSNLPKQGLIDIVKLAKERSIPIRVGVNKGSVKESVTSEGLAALAVESAGRIEDIGYDKIVLAVKSSDVRETVAAYRALSKISSYPLHIGLTEAGTQKSGTIKSAIAIGTLLLDGIGDTLRVSLATDPVEEIYAAKSILRAVGVDKNFVEVIACPTCARTGIDIEGIGQELERRTSHLGKNLKIAVMGCTVNGIGESKGADFGVAGGKEKSVLFRNGVIYKTVENEKVLEELMRLTEEYENE